MILCQIVLVLPASHPLLQKGVAFQSYIDIQSLNVYFEELYMRAERCVEKVVTTTCTIVCVNLLTLLLHNRSPESTESWAYCSC